MNNKVFMLSDKLINALTERGTMTQSEVTEFLSVSSDDAMAVIEQVRKDGFAGGIGTGPISRNHRTAINKEHYSKLYRKIRANNRKAKINILFKWVAVIDLVWHIIESTVQFLK